MRASVLDLTPVPSGSSAAQALANTIDLARHAEALGLVRYWLAEHHNAGALASSSPEIVMGAVAGATSRIRVGSGGIMLPNHSPLNVAEKFRVLAALYGDRIDLGVGRAAGTDTKTALALRQARELLAPESFPAQLDELLAFLAYEPDPAQPFGPIKATPMGVLAPPVFYLGSGIEGAELAGRRGLGFAYAHHFAPDGAAAAVHAYREAFQARTAPASLERPYAILATAVLCGASDETAEDLARCADLAFLRFGQGLRDLPMPSIEEARLYAFDADEEAFRDSYRSRLIVGGPARVGGRLRELLAETRPDELMITAGIHDHEERKRSYTRIVEALAGGPP